jgi:uncharacterized protein with NAD-binding domain and iron-sulfur cluster
MSKAQQQDGRLIILGGGIAALTAAFYASERDHEQVFPGGIHVYERSDRLGGKGASSRTSSKAMRDRIEEHGLHVWFGFYDNAFALLERCHAYLDEVAADEQRADRQRWSTSLRSVEDGFRSCNRIGLMDYNGAQWLPWVADFPEDTTIRPWTPRRDDESPLGQPTELVTRALQIVEAFLYSLTGRTFGRSDPYATFLDPSLLPNPVKLPQMAWLSQALDEYLAATRVNTGGLELASQALKLLARVLAEARARFDDVLRQHDALRRGWYIADLLLAAVRGLIDDGVLHTGDYSLIDDSELRAWLVLHGATDESVNCSFLKSIIYDLAFAYEDGDPAKPACSAATGVHGLLRVLLTYRGAIMWKMNAGMGEIVFAPIYEALIKRGVTFHFGHEATELQLERRDDRTRATSIRFAVQAFKPAFPREGGLPTLEVEAGPLAGKLPYWKVRKARDQGQLSLELRRHDMVVYGMPVDTIRQVVRGEVPNRWQTCAAEVKTVGTLALQLWLSERVQRYAPWAAPDITVGAYTEPYDTWSDMDLLAGEQVVKSDRPVRSVAYFTNVALPGVNASNMPKIVDDFMERGLTNLWPLFTRDMVIDHYPRLNDDSSSRYTLSVPGSLRARLSPLDDSISNVRPVGDWTRNSISAGCIEAAVISGMLAALALRPDRELKIFGENPRRV